jgi:hypothetical protein
VAQSIEHYLTYLEQQAAGVPATPVGTRQFINRIAADCANVHAGDLRRPLRFLRQAAALPTLRFVWIGFWLPYPLAWLLVWLWEIAGFFRYRGDWSANDVACGMIGIRHGRQVWRKGPAALAALVKRDLRE